MNKQYIPANQQEKMFAVVLKRQENLICADCGSKGPRWVSLDYGVFICMDCAGAHRTLGPSVTRVRSTNIDGWYQENFDIMESIGNATANSYWENTMPKDYIKPTINAGLDALIRFVQEKYVKKRFIPTFSCKDPKQEYIETKKSVKPFYFQQEVKPVIAKQKLGDLIDFNEPNDLFAVKNDLTKIEPPQSKITHNGTTHSLSPEKEFTDFITTKPQQNQAMHSLPQLDIINLYKSDNHNNHHMQSQQNIPAKNSNYIYLQNLDTQQQQYPYQMQQQQQHNNFAYQQNIQPAFHQQQQQQQFGFNNNIQQTIKQNGPINIMDLYQK